MGNLFGALSGGVGGFMQGLTHGLDQVQRQKNLAAQEEQLKEQTKVLKAQQVLHDQQMQATSRLAQALMSGQPQTTPAGAPTPSEFGGADMGGPGSEAGTLQQPITSPGTPPNLQSLLPDLLLSGKMPPEALTTMIGLNRNVTHVDMGDKVAIFQNGQLSGYLPKGALPMDPLTARIFGGMGAGAPSGGPAAAPPDQPGGTAAPGAPGAFPVLAPGVSLRTPTRPGNQPTLSFNQTLADKVKQTQDAGKVLEEVGRMRAQPGAPDYNAMLDKLSPHLEDPRVAGLNSRLMAEQQAAGKAENTLANLPTNSIIAIAQGVAPALKLKDGTLLDQAGAKKIVKGIMDVQAASGQARAEAWAGVRTVNMLDTAQGNRPVTIPVDELKRAAREEPNRYISAGAGVQALNKSALIEDIRGAITMTRDSLKNLKTEFTATQAAQLSVALGGNQSGQGAVDAIFASSVGKTLTPEQVDYVTNLAQLKENAMAMRSVLGAGQGSDELRAAISATIPSPRTPTKAYAGSALDKFEAQINRLARGVPTVPLKPASPGGIVPGVGEGGATGGPASPVIQGLRQKYGY